MYFRLIFGRFPLMKTQIQKPMVLMVSRCPKIEIGISAEVKFVSAVSAGGSVKFLPAM